MRLSLDLFVHCSRLGRYHVLQRRVGSCVRIEWLQRRLRLRSRQACVALATLLPSTVALLGLGVHYVGVAEGE